MPPMILSARVGAGVDALAVGVGAGIDDVVGFEVTVGFEADGVCLIAGEGGIGLACCWGLLHSLTQVL
jgi:hypothetical protein